MSNEEQIEYWNSEAAEKWTSLQETLDRQLEPMSAELLRTAAVQPGMSVLDVGCGCGATALMVGEQVGPNGRVHGVDISAPMLQRARERAESAGTTWISFTEGDAQSYEFDTDAFDVAQSRFGVMFFDDTAAAFANIRAALKPGGRFVFLCWRSVAENPWITVPMQAIQDLVELPESPDPDAPGPFALADKDRTRTLLEQAGFSDLVLSTLDRKMNLGMSPDLEASIELIFKIGPVARIMADADEDTQSKARDRIRDALKPFHTDEGIMMDAATWIVTANNGS